MQHLLPFYLFLCLAAGIAASVALVVVRRLSRYRPLSWFLVFMVCMGMNILGNLVMMYQSINLVSAYTFQAYLIACLLLPFSTMQMVAGPLFFHGFLELPFRKIADRLVLAVGVGSGLLVLTPWYGSYDFGAQRLVLGPGYLVSQVCQLTLIVYTLAIGLVFRKRQADPAKRRLLRWALLLCLAFLPGFAHDIFYFTGKGDIAKMPAVVIFYPLFYFVLALGVVWISVRWLLDHRPAAVDPALGEAVRGRRSDPARLAALGLSGREIELVPWVLEGLGNKQIAERLGISVKTVNNHLYNIYQKLGINSRWELLARLDQKDPGPEPKTTE